MGSLLKQFRKNSSPKITQLTGSPDSKSLATIDQLLLILPKRVPSALWRKLPQGNSVKALLKRQSAGAVPANSTRLNNARQTALHIGQANSAVDAFEQLVFARKMVAAATAEKAGTIGIWVAGFDADDQNALVQALSAAALAAAFVMPSYKTKDAPQKIKRIKLLGLSNRLDLTRVTAEADGNNLARWLTAQPANKLDAVSYVGFLRELATENDWQFKKYNVRELTKMGAGAFLAVAQGNADDSAAIVRLRYRPKIKTASPVLTLVGKGIIFDTGGTNLKPFSSMLEMHIDMGGSAVAVGTLLAATNAELDQSIDCWLAITENRTGPTAYKSQDVVTAMNGKTIQTIHTDAEGRMALADALVLASEDKPKVILDYATLTGTCISAVTTRYSGVFTNRPNLHPVLKKAGRDSGERVWPFPIGKEFLEDLKSDTADIKQCSPSGGGDHILAASFLQEFVDDKCAWVHVDLSACSRKGGLGHVPTEITGFGVRFSMHLIVDKDIVGNANC
jgi:leucyl aminopeptidase